MLSDRQLLLDLAAGKQSGFTLLYERHCDVLYRYAWVVSGSHSVAEDATQETFMYVIEHADAFDAARSESALGWLFGLARNRVRALTRESRRGTSNDSVDVATPSAEASFRATAAVTALLDAIRTLPLEQREVIVLCGLAELDYLTTAGVLGVPVGTVRSRLSRARQALREAVSGPECDVLEELRHGG